MIEPINSINNPTGPSAASQAEHFLEDLMAYLQSGQNPDPNMIHSLIQEIYKELGILERGDPSFQNNANAQALLKTFLKDFPQGGTPEEIAAFFNSRNSAMVNPLLAEIAQFVQDVNNGTIR